MKEDKDKWIEQVFASVEGSQRAKPDADLFAKIEKGIDDSKTIMVSFVQWRIAIAAAIVILVLNVFVMKQQYAQSNTLDGRQYVNNEITDQEFISSYKIYE